MIDENLSYGEDALNNGREDKQATLADCKTFCRPQKPCAEYIDYTTLAATCCYPEECWCLLRPRTGAMKGVIGGKL